MRSYCIRKDRFGRLDDCSTESEYPCAGAPPAVARSMARQIGDVSQPPGQIHWANWRGKERAELVASTLPSSKALTTKQGVKDFVAEYGQVIVDECHHLSAFTFEQVMKQVKAKYVLGLTATPERKDGHHPIIYMQCGPIRYKLSARSMTAPSPFEHEVIPRLTEFCLPPEQADTTIQELYAALVDDNIPQ